MPFIAMANDFQIIHSNEYYKKIYNLFYVESDTAFVVLSGISLIIFYVFRSAVNFIYLYLLSRFTNTRYYLITYRLFENYLGRSYRNFIENNSSNMTKSIVSESQGLTSIIAALLLMLSEVFVVLFIYSTMLYVNWKITILLTMLLGINTVFVLKVISKRIKTAGITREESQKKFFEIMNSTFGNFKLIKLGSRDNIVKDKFRNASYMNAKSLIRSKVLSQFPRLFLEAIGFSVVIFIIIFLVQKYQHDISSAMPMISMFILGLYRLMPSANRLLNGYNDVMYNYRSLEIVHNELIYEIEDLKNDSLEYIKKIEIKDIHFSYIQSRVILNGISFEIKKGDKIAFIGESGSGKSTLVDIIIGLYRPEKGTILIDNIELNNNNIKDWRKKIGYIPQNIYLFDGTVVDNVSFGEKVDIERVKEVLRQAKIFEFLEKDHNGVNTMVGEGGVKLSGGQKQRIAIARALYGNPEVLVLDEATSALDNKVESEIMDEIYEISKDKTLIIIAHRLSTIKGCDKVYKLNNGKLSEY